MQFTDLHLGEDSDADTMTFQLISSTLQIERPNIAIFTGDTVSGAFDNNKPNFFSENWGKLTEIL